MKKKAKKRSIARRLLHSEMVICLAVFAGFLWEYMRRRAADPVYANSYYRLHAESIIITLCLALLSAALIYRVEWETGRLD